MWAPLNIRGRWTQSGGWCHEGPKFLLSLDVWTPCPSPYSLQQFSLTSFCSSRLIHLLSLQDVPLQRIVITAHAQWLSMGKSFTLAVGKVPGVPDLDHTWESLQHTLIRNVAHRQSYAIAEWIISKLNGAHSCLALSSFQYYAYEYTLSTTMPFDVLLLIVTLPIYFTLDSCCLQFRQREFQCLVSLSWEQWCSRCWAIRYFDVL